MHRRPPRLLASLAVVAGAIALVLTGCGKDEPTAAPPSATASPTTSTPRSGDGTTGPLTGQAAEFCAKFKDFAQKANALSDGDPNTLATAKSYFQQLEDSAPADIKSDIGAFNTWVQSLSTTEQDPPAELQNAGIRIGTWAQQHCGI